MKIESLQLRNFRNYDHLDLAFPSRLTFITGPNANGKTNILEAIGLLALGKSFRGSPDQDMARDRASHYYVAAKYEKHGQHFEISMGCDVGSGKVKRKVQLNGKQLTARSQMIGQVICVIMSPTDILIADGGPAHRRRFLDMVLSYQNPEYLQNLLQYNRALRQRNTVLKRAKSGKARLSDLDAWTPALASTASKVTRARQSFIRDFEEIFLQSIATISGDRDSLRMRLLLSAPEEADDYAIALQKYASRDAAVGYTTTGPHRHNLEFGRDGLDITRFGSQGQKRSLVLALRIAQFSYLKNSLNLAPILLIDDVIRELDGQRRSAFVRLLRDSGQAVFTTPDLDGLDLYPDDLKEEISVFHVSKPGSVERDSQISDSIIRQ